MRVRLTLLEALADGVVVPVALCVPAAELLAVRVSALVGDDVADTDALDESELDGVHCGVADAVAVAEPEREGVAVPVPDPVDAAVEEAVTVLVNVTDAVISAVDVRDGVAEAVDVTVDVRVTELVAVFVGVELRDGELDFVADAVAVEGDADGVDDPVPVQLGDTVMDAGVDVADGVALADAHVSMPLCIPDGHGDAGKLVLALAGSAQNTPVGSLAAQSATMEKYPPLRDGISRPWRTKPVTLGIPHVPFTPMLEPLCGVTRRYRCCPLK